MVKRVVVSLINDGFPFLFGAPGSAGEGVEICLSVCLLVYVYVYVCFYFPFFPGGQNLKYGASLRLIVGDCG